MTTKYATLDVRRELEEKVAAMEAVKADPQWLSANKTRKQEFEKQLKSDREKLEAVTPPPINSDSERQMLKLRDEILTSAIIHGDSSQHNLDGMNTEREMKQNPPASTGRELAWGNMIKNFTVDKTSGKLRPVHPGEQGMVFEWKDIQRRLHSEREEFDPDIASVEKIRPRRDSAGHTGLPDLRSKSYASLSNLSHEEILSIFGAEGLSALARSIAQIEMEGRSHIRTDLIAQPDQESVVEPLPPSPAEQLAETRRQKITAWRTNQPLCGHTNADGTICKRPRGMGLDHCGVHGSGTKT